MKLTRQRFRDVFILLAVSIFYPFSMVFSAGAIQSATPAAPEIRFAVAVSRHAALITWYASRNPELDGYRLFRSHENSAWEEVNPDGLIPSDQTSYQDWDLAEGDYRYYLTAVDFSGAESSPSDEVSVHIGPDIRVTVIPPKGALLNGEIIFMGILLQPRFDFNSSQGVTVAANFANPKPHGISLRIRPDGPVPLGADNPSATLRLQVSSLEDVVEQDFQIKLTVTGTDDSGAYVRVVERVPMHLATLQGKESFITLGIREKLLEVGHGANFIGRLLPVIPDATVSLRIRPECGNQETIIPGIPVDENGYFIQELFPDQAGKYCVSAFWDGDANYGPAESEVLDDIMVIPRFSRITCTATMAAGDTSGDIYGYIFPTPDPGTPVNLLFEFRSSNASQSITFEQQTFTGRFDPEHHPGSYLVSVDFAEHTPSGVQGAWYVTASWDGNQSTLRGATSETYVFPFTNDPVTGKMIIVSGARNTTPDEEWRTGWNLSDFVYQTAKTRGFTDDQIVLLSMDTGQPGFDAIPTCDNIADAILDSQAGPGVPLHFYIIGPTVVSAETDSVSYILNPTGERLTGGALSGMLDELPDYTPIVVYLDGHSTGGMLPELCSDRQQRNIISFSGMGPTILAYSGNLSLSRYFFTLINQGANLAEAFAGTYSITAELPDVLHVQPPLIDAAGITGGQPGDCMPNESGELALLHRAYLGFGHWPGRVSPITMGFAEHQSVPQYSGNGLPPAPADTTNGLGIWVLCEDPEEDLDSEMQNPFLILVYPDGNVAGFGPDQFQPHDVTGFITRIPYTMFTLAGNYTAITIQVDSRGNMSFPATTQITAYNYEPQILLSGYSTTYLTRTGGYLSIQTMVFDLNGIGDVDEVGVTLDNYPIGITLTPTAVSDKYGLFSAFLDLNGYDLDPGQVFLDVFARDKAGNFANGSQKLHVSVNTLLIPILHR